MSVNDRFAAIRKGLLEYLILRIVAADGRRLNLRMGCWRIRIDFGALPVLLIWLAYQHVPEVRNVVDRLPAIWEDLRRAITQPR